MTNARAYEVLSNIQSALEYLGHPSEIIAVEAAQALKNLD
ncbi:MAG: hypothetical protein QOI59_81 [Gammaproteobacteria bacterium]|jgi:hypothetical protein|nr:hypothetical protein [Gammaproteobacteria bacterium]